MVFPYFIENNLKSENQSGFKPRDFCINQLLAITHQVFFSFDDNYEVSPIDTRRRFTVYKTSIRRRRRRIDVL